MDERDTWADLERLGLVRRGHVEAGERHATVRLESLQPLVDPSMTKALADQLSSALGTPPPDVVVAWAGLPSLLLGFLVGVARDARVVRLADDEGLVYASSDLSAGESAVLVGDRLSDRDVRLARAFVENKGARLAQLAALVDEGTSPDLVSLVSLDTRTYRADECPMCRENVPLETFPTSATSR